MASTKFARERSPPPTVRYKHSLPLHEAGPFAQLLIRQCLKLLDGIHDELVAVSRSHACFDEIRAGHTIRTNTPRIHAVSGILRAYLDRDPSVSVGKVALILWDCQYDMRRERQREPRW